MKTGRLDAFRVRGEWCRWKNLAKTFGYFFFGLVLLAFIIHAMISRPAH